MFRTPNRIALAAVTVAMAIATGAFAQGAMTFGEKLGVMPRTATNRADVNGTGRVTATLDGTTLTVNGEYSGLSTPATVVAIHNQPMGNTGPEVATFPAPGGRSGSFSGTISLTPEQLKMLQDNALAVIIRSEGNANGELRAWLVARTN